MKIYLIAVWAFSFLGLIVSNSTVSAEALVYEFRSPELQVIPIDMGRLINPIFLDPSLMQGHYHEYPIPTSRGRIPSLTTVNFELEHLWLNTLGLNQYDTRPINEIIGYDFDPLFKNRPQMHPEKPGSLQSYLVRVPVNLNGMAEYVGGTVSILWGDPKEPASVWVTGLTANSEVHLGPLIGYVEKLGSKGTKVLFNMVGIGPADTPTLKELNDPEISIEILIRALAYFGINPEIIVSQSYGYLVTTGFLKHNYFKNGSFHLAYGTDTDLVKTLTIPGGIAKSLIPFGRQMNLLELPEKIFGPLIVTREDFARALYYGMRTNYSVTHARGFMDDIMNPSRDYLGRDKKLLKSLLVAMGFWGEEYVKWGDDIKKLPRVERLSGIEQQHHIVFAGGTKDRMHPALTKLGLAPSINSKGGGVRAEVVSIFDGPHLAMDKEALLQIARRVIQGEEYVKTELRATGRGGIRPNVLEEKRDLIGAVRCVSDVARASQPWRDGK